MNEKIESDVKLDPPYTTFESAYSEINRILESKRHKWTLRAIPSVDFSDVKQIILLHIWKKWELYDSKQKLAPWVSRIVTRQMINLIRNIYSSYSRPCLKCSENQGGDLCGAYGHQTNKCPLYALWEQTKKRAFNVKLAVSTENHQQEISEMPDTSVNMDKAMQTIHEHMKLVLRPVELKVFEMIYIKHMEDEDVAKEMGYVAGENNRKPGYSRISQIRRIIINQVRKSKDLIDIF